MKAISRSSRLVAALAATTGLLLTGCSTGAGQPNAAAIIGDKVISVAEVQRRIDGGLAAQDPEYLRLQSQNKLDQAGRGLLSVLVRLELLERLAQREGVQVDNGMVDSVIASLAGNSLPEEAFPAYDTQTLRERIRGDMLATEIGKKYANRTTVTTDIVVTDSRDDAVAKANQMAKGPAATAQLVKAEAAKKRQAESNFRVSFSQASPVLAVSPLFATGENTVVAFPLADNSGQRQQQATPTSRWAVAYVHKRDTKTTSAANPEAAAAQGQIVGTLGRGMASILGNELGMRINPRYGAWDLTTAQLVTSTLERATLQLKATAPRS
ncbi:SurA N-terminal domain-containing protein [Allokutzneria sp. NRRL B-24872]|uniref:SurA N-terminal domain-containing protein n=1 Tax=Allokutzneria sp. NRRL B-24872 TaxID=1137961 RepID=UPI000A3D28B2|nr:SurA N-terminal domain-containing protein [Allokutzneria sp. NRRL B-24872]